MFNWGCAKLRIDLLIWSSKLKSIRFKLWPLNQTRSANKRESTTHVRRSAHLGTSFYFTIVSQYVFGWVFKVKEKLPVFDESAKTLHISCYNAKCSKCFVWISSCLGTCCKCWCQQRRTGGTMHEQKAIWCLLSIAMHNWIYFFFFKKLFQFFSYTVVSTSILILDKGQQQGPCI